MSSNNKLSKREATLSATTKENEERICLRSKRVYKASNTIDKRARADGAKWCNEIFIKKKNKKKNNNNAKATQLLRKV